MSRLQHLSTTLLENGDTLCLDTEESYVSLLSDLASDVGRLLCTSLQSKSCFHQFLAVLSAFKQG